MEYNPQLGHRAHSVVNKRTFDQYQADEVPVASGSASSSPSSASDNMSDDPTTRKRVRSSSPHPDSPTPQRQDTDMAQSATASAPESGTSDGPSLTDILASSSTLPIHLSTTPPHVPDTENLAPAERLQRSLAHSGAFDRQLDLIRRSISPGFAPTRWPTPSPVSSDDEQEFPYIPQPDNTRANNNNNDIGRNMSTSSLAHALGPPHPQPVAPHAAVSAPIPEPDDAFDLVTVATMDTESLQNRDQDDLSDIEMDDHAFELVDAQLVESQLFPTLAPTAPSQPGPSGISRPQENSPSRHSVTSDTSSAYFSASSQSSPARPTQPSTSVQPQPTPPRHPILPFLLTFSSAPTASDSYDSDSSAASLQAHPSVEDHRSSISSISSQSPPVDDVRPETDFSSMFDFFRRDATTTRVAGQGGPGAGGSIANTDPLDASERGRYERPHRPLPEATPSNPESSTPHVRFNHTYISRPRMLPTVRPLPPNRRTDVGVQANPASTSPTSPSAPTTSSAEFQRPQNLRAAIHDILHDSQRFPRLAELDRGNSSNLPETGLDIRLRIGRNGQVLSATEYQAPANADDDQSTRTMRTTPYSANPANPSTTSSTNPPSSSPTRPYPVSSVPPVNPSLGFRMFPDLTFPTSNGPRAPLPNTSPTNAASYPTMPGAYTNINVDNFRGPFRDTMRRTLELRSRQAGNNANNNINNNTRSGQQYPYPTIVSRPTAAPPISTNPTGRTHYSNDGSIVSNPYYPFVPPGRSTTGAPPPQESSSPHTARATETTSSLSPLPYRPQYPSFFSTSRSSHESNTPFLGWGYSNMDSSTDLHYWGEALRTDMTPRSGANPPSRLSLGHVPVPWTAGVVPSDDELGSGSDTVSVSRRDSTVNRREGETLHNTTRSSSDQQFSQLRLPPTHISTQYQQLPIREPPVPQGSTNQSIPRHRQQHLQSMMRQEQHEQRQQSRVESSLRAGRMLNRPLPSSVSNAPVESSRSAIRSLARNLASRPNPSDSSARSNSSSQSNAANALRSSRARRAELSTERHLADLERRQSAAHRRWDDGLDLLVDDLAARERELERAVSQSAIIFGELHPRNTPRQAIANLPSGTYGQWSTPGETEECCPICLDDYQPDTEVLRIPACQHWIHKPCLTQWLGRANTCPICRASVGRSTTAPRPAPSAPASILRRFTRRHQPPNPTPVPAPGPSRTNNRNTDNNRPRPVPLPTPRRRTTLEDLMAADFAFSTIPDLDLVIDDSSDEDDDDDDDATPFPGSL